MMLGTAAVLSIVVLCSLAPFCQTIPLHWRSRDGFAREEEGIVGNVAARISSELKALMEQQTGGASCSQDIFTYTNGADLYESVTSHTNGTTGERTRRSNILYECNPIHFALFISKNGGNFMRARTDSITYICEHGSTYESSVREQGLPRCLPKCPTLPSILNGGVDYPNREPDTSATYFCSSDKFVLVGSKMRKCGRDGNWIGIEPKCVLPCPELQNIANGAVSYGNRLPDDTATYSCDKGYLLRGDRTRMCGQGGEWSGQEPRCIPLCPELQGIANGAVNYASQEPGATATYSCDSGYTLQGAMTRICGQGGEWSGQEPRCIPLCPELQGIANGAVNYASRQPGARATYSCDSGYILQGAMTRTCGQGGQWSGQEPRCIPLCPDLQAIENGAVNYGNREPGDTATYSCNEGHLLRGTMIRTCGQDGRWSGQEPRCVPLCPELPAIANGAVNYGNREPGDVATYTCRDGYRLKGLEKRTCGQDGNWIGVDPVCEIIICPLVGPISNGDSSASRSPIAGPGGSQGFGVGTVVTYTCSSGYLLQGESTQTCLVRGEWNRPQPRCAPAKCPELKLKNIPKNVPEARDQLKNHPNYYELIYKQYYSRRIEGDRSEGSKAYLTCLNGWKLMEGTPAVQECVMENGALVWTTPGICVYTYTYPKYG